MARKSILDRVREWMWAAIISDAPHPTPMLLCDFYDPMGQHIYQSIGAWQAALLARTATCPALRPLAPQVLDTARAVRKMLRRQQALRFAINPDPDTKWLPPAQQRQPQVPDALRLAIEDLLAASQPYTDAKLPEPSSHGAELLPHLSLVQALAHDHCANLEAALGEKFSA